MTRLHAFFWALCLAIGLPWVGPPPAAATRTFAEPVVACDLTGTPTSVVVDVYDASAPAALLATIPNGEVDQVGATSCYLTDLSQTAEAIDFPAAGDPDEKIYVTVFRDDAGNERRSLVTVIGFPGPGPVHRSCVREVPEYASAPIVARGLTQPLINGGNPSYLRIEIDCTRSFVSPVFTYYLVPFYQANGGTTDWRPSSTVPSP